MTIVLFAKFPPPHTGMTIATKMYSRMVEEEIEVERVNTSYGTIKPSEIGIERFRYDLLFSAQFAQRLWTLRNRVRDSETQILYLVASPSLLGVARNVLAVAVARPHVEHIVAHVHNGNYHEIFEGPFSGKIAEYLVQNVDRFVFLSKVLSERASGYIPPVKRSVVHNTISSDVQCTSDEVEQKVKMRSRREKLRVLFLSNMIPSKGYMDVARAISILQRDMREIAVQASFIGDWPDERRRGEFRSFLEREGIEDSVRIHGRVTNRADIKSALLSADVSLLPSYYPNEAQPLSIIEAMNAGTPVIATEHASIPEYVFDNENGYLVDKKSPLQIKRSLEALTDRSNWQVKARTARRTYEEMFSPDAVQDAMLRVILGEG